MVTNASFHICMTVQLTLPVPCISESCIEIKIKFLFSHFFEVPQKVLTYFFLFLRDWDGKS